MPFEIETQQKLNWCWAAVAATAARYFFPKQTLTQCTIAKGVLGLDCCQDPAAGCDEPAALQTALDAVNTALGKSLNNLPQGGTLAFESVRAQIDSGRPVCVRIQWFGTSGAHFVMIDGYSVSQSGEPWVDIADPYYEDSTLPYEQFVFGYLNAGAWSDTYLLAQS
jgi:Papain-like cysteine protease AvrRpt2